MQNLTLCVARPSSGLNPHEPVLVSSPNLPLQDNQVLIEVDRFGFSANNVTYQALGEAPHFRYFEFNSPPTVGDVSPSTHGLIPVWGFGTIVESTHAQLSVGERVYGYFAPTRYLLVPVTNVNKYNFYVPRPHLPADRRPYNTIRRCATDPQYDPSPLSEDLTMLYRPLSGRRTAPAAATTHFSTNTSLIDPSKVEPTNDLKLEQFFMPEWLAVRQKQLTIEQITGMQAQAWKELMTDGKDWVKINRVYGGTAVVDAYKTIAQNGTDAASGLIWSLWDGPELGRQAVEGSKL